MFEKDDEKYLLRQLGNNQVVLFLGSGFSLDAKNKAKENFPTGWGLSEKLWEFLEFPDDYDGTSLPEMYQSFLGKAVKREYKTDFLEKYLLSSAVPEVYNNLTIPHWFKIYTTNIDDIIQKTYRRKGKSIEELQYPFDQYSERDQSLEKIQIVYLHGKLPCLPEEVIFSPQQYAKAQLTHEPLYGQFVYDYSSLPTVFIGTELNEPLFERYIVARDARFGLRERRPKSFLISPSLSPVKVENLKSNYNVHHIKGTTKDFLDWMNSIKDRLPERKEILKTTFPNLLSISEYADLAEISKKSIRQFAQCFNRVPKELTPFDERSGFLLGTSPRWNDIVRDLDVPRTITSNIVESADKFLDSTHEKDRCELLSISGYAGSGKSTILKRLGYTLSQQGRTVFLSYSDFIPKKDEVLDVLAAIDERVVLLFDNAKNALSQLPILINAINNQLKHPVLFIVSIRSNFSDQVGQHLTPDLLNINKFHIPNLDDNEINNLIEKLDENNLLGKLNGMSDVQRVHEFQNRAHRQILIAMKEATNGMSFNDIVRNEYDSLTPSEARILALCLALNTQLGFTNSKQDIVGFSKSAQNEALNYLETVLQGTIISVGSTKNRYMLRHRILADYIIKKCATSVDLREAYIRVLSVLAPELIEAKGPSRIFNLYKALINHKLLYRRFRSEIDLAREVYDSITDYFKSDHHFWLQYGSLEVEGRGGDLDLAENYISQAESLSPNSSYVKTAKCNLFYKQAQSASDYDKAVEIKLRADELAHSLILEIGKDEQIIFHIYCSGRYNFLKKWVADKVSKKEELDELRSSVKTGLTFHPFSKKLSLIEAAIKRAYVQLGIDSTLEDPEIPDFE
jgi:ABC-type dipeptide/oligopeptide/nickel transport system ATPase subunit